jgi:molecular chaperone Hsp33
MKDILQRGQSEKKQVRIYSVNTLEIARELTTLHQTTPNATYALCQSVTAAALLSASLKPESRQSLAYKINGSGPIESIYIQADSRGNIRGTIGNPDVDLDVELDKISFSKIIGAGTITVIKDLEMKEPYTSVSPILFGSIAKDTAYYLTSSEQVPSALIIACETSADGEILVSAGILIQTWPETDSSIIETIDANIKNAAPLGDHLLDKKDINDYIKDILDDQDIEIFSTTELSHTCPCSKEAFNRSLHLISSGDIKEMIEEDGKAEIVCTFCKTNYHFSKDELETIVQEKEETRPQ